MTDFECPRGALDDARWLRVERALRALRDPRGRPGADDRRFLHAVLWMLKTGAPWRDLPPSLGGWRAVHARFLRWARKGLWQKLARELEPIKAVDLACLDSMSAKAAPCAAGARKNRQGHARSQQRQALGRSAGGLTAKIHAAVLENGRLLAVAATPGAKGDAPLAPWLLRESALFRPRAVCADRAYDSNALREKISALGAVPVIPSKKNRRVPVAHDPAIYRRRNVVERYFRRLKNQRKLALRTDKAKAAFLAWVWVAEAVDILKTKH